MADIVEVIQTVQEVVVQETPPDNVILTSPIGIVLGGGGGGGADLTLGNPQSTELLISNLGPGSSASRDADLITEFMTGRLWWVSIGSAVPIRVDIEKVVNAARSYYDHLYKTAAGPAPWASPDPRFFTALGDTLTKFGITVTNLSPHLTSDVRAVIYWD